MEKELDRNRIKSSQCTFRCTHCHWLAWCAPQLTNQSTNYPVLASTLPDPNGDGRTNEQTDSRLLCTPPPPQRHGEPIYTLLIDHITSITTSFAFHLTQWTTKSYLSTYRCRRARQGVNDVRGGCQIDRQVQYIILFDSDAALRDNDTTNQVTRHDHCDPY